MTSSKSNSPESSQVRIHLQAHSNNTLALPVSYDDGRRCLRLTHFLGFGSTGKVWQSHFDNNNESFAVKIVEFLYSSDIECRDRLHNEYRAYLIIEAAYRSGCLRHLITPRCYGAFHGDDIDILILDIGDGVLKKWDELNDS